jgi:hypothetical protein
MVKSVKQLIKVINNQDDTDVLHQLNEAIIRRMREINASKMIEYKDIVRRGDIVYLEFSDGTKPVIVTDVRVSRFDVIYINNIGVKENYTAHFSMIKHYIKTNIGKTKSKRTFLSKIKCAMKGWAMPQDINYFIDTALVYAYGTLSLWGSADTYYINNKNHERLTKSNQSYGFG